MSGSRARRRAGLAWLAIGSVVVALAAQPGITAAQGVGDATWTPSRSSTSARPGTFLVADDAIVYVTHATWDAGQVEGLAAYARDDGLRYTHEVRDVSGRLSATGYWTTNLPDPAYDRDDDNGDGRWEEAEITAGARPLMADTTYTTRIELARWHGKREGGRCRWAWDRRAGSTVILSQLSRDILGEWQALRYTSAYATLPYPRVGPRPDLPEDVPAARCRERRPGPAQSGIVVTFAEPLRWSDLVALPGAGSGSWMAFEAIGSSERDSLPWTCGGPVLVERRLRPCRALGVQPDGVTAATGYFDAEAIAILRDHPSVARVGELRDVITGLLFDVGGFGVEAPDLTVNDAWWDLFLAE